MRFASLLLLVTFASPAVSHKILVYNSKYGHSHSNFLGNIADLLVDAGHDVVSALSSLIFDLSFDFVGFLLAWPHDSYD